MVCNGFFVLIADFCYKLMLMYSLLRTYIYYAKVTRNIAAAKIYEYRRFKRGKKKIEGFCENYTRICYQLMDCKL